MPLDVSGVLIVLMMSGKKLSELRFVFILYSQDTFATTYGYVLCLPIGQAAVLRHPMPPRVAWLRQAMRIRRKRE